MMVEPSSWLSSLGAAARSLTNASSDIDARMHQALQVCLRALGDVAWVDLRDDNSAAPSRVLVTDDHDVAVRWRAVGVHPCDHHPSWCAAVSGQEVRRDTIGSSDIAQLASSSSPHLRMLGRLSPSSLLSIPLQLGNVLVGAITIAMLAPRRNRASAQAEPLRELASLITAQIGYARCTAQQDSIQAGERVKDDFLAILGHELRNPLAPISTSLELMARREPDRLIKERLVMGRQVAHLSRLVDDLLDVSRLARGKVHLRPERFDLRTVVSQAVADAAPAFEGKAALAVRQPDHPVWVDADPVRMGQAITQLLLNAAKFTPPEGQVHLDLRREQDHVWLRVEDTGCGIDAQLLPRAFDLFVQAPQALDRPRGGLGLGLSLVRNLVELHGGSITARSPGVGHGSSFDLWLPACNVVDDTRPAITSILSSGARSTQGVRILLVDDNREACRSLADMLDLIGFEVRTAEDSHEALTLMTVFQPQIAVLDFGSPHLDGYELARRIRRSPAHAALPLIAVTGHGTDADRVRALDAGVDEHLVKPVLIDPLLATVERLLGAVPDARCVREPRLKLVA